MFYSGVMAPPKDQVTSQGYDLQFGTNVLGIPSIVYHSLSFQIVSRSLSQGISISQDFSFLLSFWERNLVQTARHAS